MASRHFRFRSGAWPLGEKTYILAIINVTPDSFSDGRQQALDPAYQCERAGRLIEEGADGLDLGAESTRPGSTPISPGEEWSRLEPVLRAVRRAFPNTPISVDTYKASIAERALGEGADIINDIWGLTRSPDMASLVARSHAGYIGMFNGPPARQPITIGQVRTFFQGLLRQTFQAGLSHEAILIDPGVGFRLQGKDSWEVLTHLGLLSGIGSGIMVGHSRKRFIGHVTGVAEAQDRDLPTAVLSALMARDGVDVVRVHNALATRQALQIVQQWEGSRGNH